MTTKEKENMWLRSLFETYNTSCYMVVVVVVVCDIWPNLDGLVVAHECCVHMFSTTLLVEQEWSQLISLCPLTIAPSG